MAKWPKGLKLLLSQNTRYEIMHYLDVIFSNFSFSILNRLLESWRIQNITPLIRAAKKHQTESKYCVKNIPVIRQDNVIRIPSK
jgi:hypothetical protein